MILKMLGLGEGVGNFFAAAASGWGLGDLRGEMGMLNFMEDMARRAGEICLQESVLMTEERVEYKSAFDLVTPVDRKVEDFLRGEIRKRFPDHAIIGEERGASGSGSGSCWVLDPIDGTTSYVHGLPGYTVSIALQRGGQTVAGVVYAPVLDLMFSSEKGAGAHCNGQRLRVSSRAELAHAVLTTGFGCLRDDPQGTDLAIFLRLASQARDIRRHGSAALDLAWVAAGRLDGYWEKNLKLHDIAAGILLVTEAGGTVTDYLGSAGYPAAGLVASNGLLEGQLLTVLQQANPDIA